MPVLIEVIEENNLFLTIKKGLTYHNFSNHSMMKILSERVYIYFLLKISLDKNYLNSYTKIILKLL